MMYRIIVDDDLCTTVVRDDGSPVGTAASSVDASLFMFELQAKREKVLRELSILIHEWEVVAEGTAHWSSLNRVYRKIESMREELRQESKGEGKCL